MTKRLADDCFFHDKDRMPHEEALAVLRSRVRPVLGTSWMGSGGLGRSGCPLARCGASLCVRKPPATRPGPWTALRVMV